MLIMMYIMLSFHHSNKNMMNKEEANELKDKVQAWSIKVPAYIARYPKLARPRIY